MSKVGGLQDNFYVGGYDLSGDVNSVDQISTPWDVFDTTALKDEAHERKLTLRTGSLQFTTFMDDTGTTTTPAVPASGTPYISTFGWYTLVTVTGGTVTAVDVNGSQVGTGDGTYLLPPYASITLVYSVAPTWSWEGLGAAHNALSALPRTDVIGSYFNAQAIGNPAACLVGKQVNYDWTRDNTGGLTGKVTLTANSYGLEWGEQLTPGVRADTTPASGASQNDGAATSYGAQAYLQLIALAGTSVDVVIEHSADNATWTTLFDFGAQSSAPYAARMALANTATVDQYLRVTTTGTFTYARFAVMLARNPIAGITF